MNEVLVEHLFSSAQRLVSEIKPDVNGGRVGRYTIDPTFLNPIWREGFVPVTVNLDHIQQTGDLVIYHKQSSLSNSVPRTGCLASFFKVFGLVTSDSRPFQIVEETDITLLVKLGTETNNNLKYDLTQIVASNGQRDYFIQTFEPHFMGMEVGSRAIDSRGFSAGKPTGKELLAMERLIHAVSIDNPVPSIREGQQTP